MIQEGTEVGVYRRQVFYDSKGRLIGQAMPVFRSLKVFKRFDDADKMFESFGADK